MRSFLCLCLLVSFVGAQAQDESLPDLRNKKESFLKSPKGEIRDDLATFTIGGIDERLGKEPLQKIPATDYNMHSITFEGNNPAIAGQALKVVITSGTFEASKHKLFYYYDKKYLVKIDGKPYYGDYGTVPTTTISSVNVILNNKDTVAVPPAAFADLYHPEFTYSEGGTIKTHNAVYLSKDKHRMYIYMVNNEAIGKYEVTWILQDNKYVGRVVDSGIMK
ncbi:MULTISPECIES: hypothetical protein [Niastella]|uniref:DUF4138 domain-containing protein n=1 Tax=Niastella soli TaxID=2821487 RepID=A0ABS3YS37_9BACT|nr:hypothetical protein [Niastella soli]MBO9200708.1 hypothetical protein [Niastella soli]